MTTSTRRPGEHAQPIRGPGELVQAIPYLIGYHPAESVVLVGLHRGRLVVTVRLDLADLDVDGDGVGLLEHTAARAVDGGATEFVVVVYTETAEPTPGPDVVATAEVALASVGALLLDAVLVCAGRWSSCRSTGPVGGWDLDVTPSPFVAQATVAGAAPLCDRAAVAASLDPCPDEVRFALEGALAESENAAVSAVLNGSRARHDRAATRALLAAVTACHEPGWVPPASDELARLAVALTSIETRDEVWLVIEAGSVDGRPLMLELARRCPPPYDVAPLFLYGWACWRSGNSMLAGVAARRAVASDPGYTAAQMLVDAVEQGIDPHRLPRLRRPCRPRQPRRRR